MIYSKIVIRAKQNLDASLNIKLKAQDLRKNMTETEKVLWSHLRKRQQLGMYFRRQHPYGIYILDFYCFEANLAIEIDGMIHINRHTYDNERTKFLESSGLKVMRFKNEDVENRIEWVLNSIRSYLKKIHPNDEKSPKRVTIISPLGETGKRVNQRRELNDERSPWNVTIISPLRETGKGVNKCEESRFLGN